MEKRMTRKEELLKILEIVEEGKKAVVLPIIDDVVYLEEELKHLRTLPKITVHPKYADRMKTTPAYRQYKELLQQYRESLKFICSVIHKDDVESQNELLDKLSEFV